MKKLIALLVVLGVAAACAGRGYQWWSENVYTPVSSHSEKVSFSVKEGESPAEIADALAGHHLIRSPEAFMLYLRLSGRGSALQAGDFVLDRDMTVPQIVDALQHGRSAQVAVRVPEGIGARFQAQTIEQQGFIKAADYLAAASDPSWKSQYDFLAQLPSGRSPMLEGYLLPDTYYLDRGATARDLVKAELDAFGRFWTPDLRQAIGQKTPARPPVSIDEVVILASLADREVNRPEELPRACEVYYNRLQAHEPLGVDATIVYALGLLNKNLTQDDLKLNSPYNTRTHAGLPPGPIGNPTPAAMRACANPEQNDYFFYFTDRNGTTHFEKTMAQFNSDIAKYGVLGQ